MVIPLDSKQVSKEWLNSVINVKEVKEVIGHVNEGGVLSSIFKAKIIDNDGQERKLFIKIMPNPDQDQRILIEGFGLDKREVKTYVKLFKELEDFEETQLGVKNIQSIICDFWAADCSDVKEKRGFYIILDDVSQDFKMPDLDKGMTKDQIIDALEKLAYFHSLTYCYRNMKNSIDYLIDYPMVYQDFLDSKNTREFFDSLFKKAILQLKETHRDDLAKILEKLSKNYVEKFKMAFGGTDGRFLTHGDMWSNNIMFDKNGKCILVDWQFTCASTPYLDIASMAFMNQNPEEMESNSNTFLQAYFNKFNKICAKFKVGGPWHDFKGFSTEATHQGFLSLFAWLMLSFDPCVYTRRIFDRFVYIFEKALNFHPEFFA